MADIDIMRGLDALDQAIRDSVLPNSPPGAGLYLLLDSLAVSTLGASRSAFPVAAEGREGATWPDRGADPGNPLGAPLETDGRSGGPVPSFPGYERR